MAVSPKLGFTLMENNQAGAEILFNRATRRIEALACLVIQDQDLSAPPGGESEGECWEVSGTGTGAWAGHDGEIAVYENGAYVFFDKFAGLIAWIADDETLSVYDELV